MPVLLDIAFGMLGIAYAGVDLWLLSGLGRLRNRSVPSQQPAQNPQNGVSVLVCARNEERRISCCLDRLLAQQDPGVPWEILVADDRSTDGTISILEKYQTSHPDRIRILKIEDCPAGWSPKKHAISRLIELAKGDVLLLTDADCLVPPGWIRGMLAMFHRDSAMVAGFSRYYPAEDNHGWLFGTQALDFLSHHIVGAAAISGHTPITCCGNNLAYTRQFFHSVGGYGDLRGVTSGDDDLLLQKAAILNPQGISYCTNPDTFVTTFAETTVRGVWNQRKRWASKTPRYRPAVVILLSLVFAFYCAILLAAILSPWLGVKALVLAVLGWAWKTGWDSLVTIRGARLLHSADLLSWFWLTAALHIPMIVGAVLFGALGAFRWKDQPLASHS